MAVDDNEFIGHENLGAVDDSSSDGNYHPLAERFGEFSDNDDYPRDGDDGIDPSNNDITKGAILSLFFALFIRYRLTKGCLGDLLHLLNLIVPNCVSRTNYFFDKMFFFDTVVKMHFYCPDFQSYLGEPNNDKQHTCGICQRDFEENSLFFHSKTYFLSTSIEAQLRDILENDDKLWRKISSNKQKSVLQHCKVRGEI